MIVTIDGPAGSGKSTAARGLAARLGFRFLDTGAMFRAVAHACLQADVELQNDEQVAAVANGLDLRFEDGRVITDGVDVTDAIRTPDVTNIASVVAVNPGVRDALAKLQREIAVGANIITEGRDQGTVVFPDAECKFFLIADDTIRAKRRQGEFKQTGTQVSRDETLSQLRERDERDATRKVAPLKPADDAILIDTSTMSVDEMLAELERQVHERREAIGCGELPNSG